MSTPRLAPEAHLWSGGESLPAAARACVSSITLQSGIEGVDRLEIRLANPGLRWLESPLFALGRELRLSLGHAPDPLEPVFVGDVVGQNPTFPANDVPTLTVVAHDRRERLQRGTKTRWFAVAIPCVGTLPIPDMAILGTVAAEGHLMLATDPVSLAISAALGGVEYGVRAASAKGMHELVRKQRGETDLAFVSTIALENGWALTVDHGGSLAGNVLRFTSLLSQVTPDFTLRYGESLVDFSPRLTRVGEIAAVKARFWVAEAKLELTVTAGWDWDRQALTVSVVPSFGLPSTPEPAPGGAADGAALVLVDEAVDATTAPRVILGKLLPKLNRRLTGTASVPGDTRVRPGRVVQFEGMGRFGGPYRIVSATSTLDASGFRTSFDVRKEVWFDDGQLLRGLTGALAVATPAGLARQLQEAS